MVEEFIKQVRRGGPGRDFSHVCRLDKLNAIHGSKVVDVAETGNQAGSCDITCMLIKRHERRPCQSAGYGRRGTGVQRQYLSGVS
jgi:hypothetical protein